MGSPRPAKSVRKLTTPTVVSKKFWPRALTNSMAGGLCFSARNQTHDHSNYEQRDNTNSDIQRTDFIHQPFFFRRWAGNRRRRRGRRVLSRQHRLRILQPLKRVVVLWIDLQHGLVIRDRVFVLLRQAVGVSTLRRRFHVVRIFRYQKCVIGYGG